MERLRKYFKDETGATAVEYGLLVAVIAAVIIGAVTAFGRSLSDVFSGLRDFVAGLLPIGGGSP